MLEGVDASPGDWGPEGACSGGHCVHQQSECGSRWSDHGEQIDVEHLFPAGQGLASPTHRLL